MQGRGEVGEQLGADALRHEADGERGGSPPQRPGAPARSFAAAISPLDLAHAHLLQAEEIVLGHDADEAAVPVHHDDVAHRRCAP